MNPPSICYLFYDGGEIVSFGELSHSQTVGLAPPGQMLEIRSTRLEMYRIWLANWAAIGREG